MSNPSALNVATNLLSEFTTFPPFALSSEPETGAVSFQWPTYRVFLYIEDGTKISLHYYSQDNLQEHIQMFEYPVNLSALICELTSLLQLQRHPQLRIKEPPAMHDDLDC